MAGSLPLDEFNFDYAIYLQTYKDQDNIKNNISLEKIRMNNWYVDGVMLHDEFIEKLRRLNEKWQVQYIT
jgi:hypothetical protein